MTHTLSNYDTVLLLFSFLCVRISIIILTVINFSSVITIFTRKYKIDRIGKKNLIKNMEVKH